MFRTVFDRFSLGDIEKAQILPRCCKETWRNFGKKQLFQHEIAILGLNKELTLGEVLKLHPLSPFRLAR